MSDHDHPAKMNETGPESRKPITGGILRRVSMAAALAVPLAAHGMADERAPTPARAGAATPAAVEALVERAGLVASAFIRGDMKAFVKLNPMAADFTLMQPFGGAFSRGFDSGDEHLAELSRYFQGGDAKLELVESYASGDMVVLAVIERQTGKVGGLPEQDWSLRVTLVYRWDGADWLLVHRHADALVHSIDIEQLSALAKGIRLTQ